MTSETPEEPGHDPQVPPPDDVPQALDEVPPDLPIPDEDNEPQEDPWVPVPDGASEDVPIPQLDDSPEPDEDPWLPISDDSTDDLDLPVLEEPQLDNPWEPVGYGPVEESPPPRRALPQSGFEPPRTRPRPTPAHTARTIPWRSTADLLEPNLPSLLCVADVTAVGSRLLVAAWSWVEEGAGDRLRFSLSDDGPELEAAAATPHEAALETVLRLADQQIRLRLHLEAVRDQRGVVLGRDVLAGRFVVDPGREDWSEEEP